MTSLHTRLLTDHHYFVIFIVSFIAIFLVRCILIYLVLEVTRSRKNSSIRRKLSTLLVLLEGDVSTIFLSMNTRSISRVPVKGNM